MARSTTGLGFALMLVAAVGAEVGRAQEGPAEPDAPGTRERQAAAEAYDKGSTAYLAHDYTTAAQWFETAHRMAPNSAALLQATRAYERGEDLPRAATLALQLMHQYPEDAEAVAYAKGLVDELAAHLVRIDVDCDACRLELEGRLLEQTSFFIEPGKKHRLIAEFDSGRREGDVYGEPGMTRLVRIDPPSEGGSPPPPVELTPVEPAEDVEPKPKREKKPEAHPEPRKDRGEDRGERDGGKPFGPLVTWIGVGVTGAGVALSVLSTLDTTGGVGDYEDAARAATECMIDCAMLEAKAQSLLEDGQAKEGRTTVLWIATGGAAAITATIALFLTDWSGGGGGAGGGKAAVRWDVRPLAGGAAGVVRGRY